MEGLVRIVAPQLTYAKAVTRYTVNGVTDFNIPFWERSSVFPFTHTPHYRGHIVDHELGYEFSVALNEVGFRTGPFAPKADDEIRVVVIGDSTTFGMGVEEPDSYPKLLEDDLNRHPPPGKTYRVINLGLGGYGPLEYYLVAKTYVPTLEPDVVITTLSTSTDYWDVLLSTVRLGARGLPVSVKRAGAYVDEHHRLRSNAVEAWVYRSPGLRNSHLAIFLAPKIARVAAFAQRGMRRSTLPVPIDRLIRGVDEIADSVGAKTVWAVLPASYNVASGDEGRFLDALSIASVRQVQNFVPLFAGLKEPLKDYYADGSHLNRRGGELVVRRLADAVKARLQE